MNDGHTGLSNHEISQEQSGNFKLILSELKHSNGNMEYVIHATPTASYSYGLQPAQFLSTIDFTPYSGQCPLLVNDPCFYYIMAQAERSFDGMQYLPQVQAVSAKFKRFAKNIDQL